MLRHFVSQVGGGVTPEVLYVSPSLFADEDTVAALGPILHSLQSGATKGGLINIHLGETEHLEERPLGNASSLLCPPSSRAFKMNQLGLSREPAAGFHHVISAPRKTKTGTPPQALTPSPVGLWWPSKHVAKLGTLHLSVPAGTMGQGTYGLRPFPDQPWGQSARGC